MLLRTQGIHERNFLKCVWGGGVKEKERQQYHNKLTLQLDTTLLIADTLTLNCFQPPADETSQNNFTL